jgi:beta-N-acetylhexosaminidase
VIDASREELERDFLPFRALADLPMAMTAHVVYRAIDPDRPATCSPTVVNQVIRGVIGYRGLVMSDDLSMNALKGPFEARTAALFDAGLDLALHCNGDLAEGRAVASAAPMLAGESLARANTALAMRLQPEPFDLAAARGDLDALVARLPAA